jgi:hypothetical protein
MLPWNLLAVKKTNLLASDIDLYTDIEGYFISR